jgi:hypothetical protein
MVNAGMKALAHGTSRAAIAKAQGQSATSGFWSGFAASGFSVGSKGYGNFASRTTMMAVVGGTVSEATGGKFANGAVSGAFVHMFNAEENYLKRVWNRAVSNYSETMDTLTVGVTNVANSASSMGVTALKNNNFKGIFYKQPYMGASKWALSGFKSTSMGFADTALFRVVEPIAIGTAAFSGGVAIGSVGVAIYDESFGN